LVTVVVGKESYFEQGLDQKQDLLYFQLDRMMMGKFVITGGPNGEN
jgi:hypothetical protein